MATDLHRGGDRYVRRPEGWRDQKRRTLIAPSEVACPLGPMSGTVQRITTRVAHIEGDDARRYFAPLDPLLSLVVGARVSYVVNASPAHCPRGYAGRAEALVVLQAKP